MKKNNIHPCCALGTLFTDLSRHFTIREMEGTLLTFAFIWTLSEWCKGGWVLARQRAKIATFRTGKYRVKDLIGVQIFPLVCILVITLFAEFAGATFCFILTFLPLCGCWPSAGLRWAALLRAQGSSETSQQNGFVLIPWNDQRVSEQVYRCTEQSRCQGCKLHRDWVLGGCKLNCANKF